MNRPELYADLRSGARVLSNDVAELASTSVMV